MSVWEITQENSDNGKSRDNEMNTSIQYATRLKGYWDFCARQQVRCEKQGNFMYLSI